MVGERGTFVFKEGKLVRKDKRVADVQAPAVHGDEMLNGVESPLTGEMYYSKEAYTKHIHAAGYKITGGDHLKGLAIDRKLDFKPDVKGLRDAAERAYYDIKYDRVEIDEKSKQHNIEEERQWNSYRKR